MGRRLTPEQYKRKKAASDLAMSLNDEIRRRGNALDQFLWTESMILAARPSVMVKTLLELQIKVNDYKFNCRSHCNMLGNPFEENEDDDDR